MVSVVTVGELLVEVMRTKKDMTLTEPGPFVGPFPSGAPGIFADSVSCLGGTVGIVAGIGDDEFGSCITDRLTADGVDCSQVFTSDNLSTGVAFVTYFSDGSRRFLYHMHNAASGLIGPEHVSPDYFDDVDVIHLNGSSLLMNDRTRRAAYEAIKHVCDAGGMISLDPNLRTELLSGGKAHEHIAPVLNQAEVIIPTESELAAVSDVSKDVTTSENTESNDNSTGEVVLSKESRRNAAVELLNGGAKLVAIKRGADGCEIHTSDRAVSHRGFDVEIIDPTGAGDAFSAAIIVGRLEKMPLDRLARFANAAGAYAVTEKGPMEGIKSRDRVEALAESGGQN